MDLVAIQADAVDLTRSLWREAGCSVNAKSVTYRRKYMVVGNFLAPTEVIDFTVARLDYQEIRRDNIADVDIIARLRAITKDGWALSVQHLLAKNGYHSGFPVGILTRSIHIRIA
jgi:hypothetical protein